VKKKLTDEQLGVLVSRAEDIVRNSGITTLPIATDAVRATVLATLIDQERGA